MTEYSSVGIFGAVKFNISDIKVSRRPSTIKTNIGKKFIEKQIPMRNAVDIVLQVSGIITGLGRAYGQTVAAAIEADRTALIALEDGYRHAHSNGRHSFNAVIATESLIWPDEAIRSTGEPYKFSMQLIQWQ